jgi:transcriptional regulator with XRE-family HTH domain
MSTYIESLIDKAAVRVGSVYRLASALGLASSTVYDWKAGRQNPSPADRARIAAFAGEDAVQELVRATIDHAKGDVRREQLVKVLGKLSRQTGAAIGTVLPVLASLSFGTLMADRFIRCIERLSRNRHFHRIFSIRPSRPFLLPDPVIGVSAGDSQPAAGSLLSIRNQRRKCATAASAAAAAA